MFQEYPKFRHRLQAGTTSIESRLVDDLDDEERRTPNVDGWTDLARALFEQERAINIERAADTPARRAVPPATARRGTPVRIE